MNKTNINYLRLYRGLPFEICKGITIHIPTLGEICDYGETKYYYMIHNLCAVGIDLCWQLEEMGIPFDEVSDYTLFWQILRNNYKTEDTKILFGDKIDLSGMSYKTDEKGNILLVQYKNETHDEVIIDEEIYYQLINYLRAMHNLKRNNAIAGSKSCRQAFIKDAKMEYEALKYEPRKSILLPLISTMVNSDGFKRNDQTVWDMNIYAFMDSVKRISKIRESTLLLQSGYSGFGIDLKKLTNKEKLLNYMGELD